MTLSFFTFLQAAPQKGGEWTFPLLMLGMFVIMWLFMIRPQQKKQKELREMRKTLDKGDKVVTQGGIYGTIVSVGESYFLIEVDSNVKIKVAKDLVYKDVSDINNTKK